VKAPFDTIVVDTLEKTPTENQKRRAENDWVP